MATIELHAYHASLKRKVSICSVPMPRILPSVDLFFL